MIPFKKEMIQLEQDFKYYFYDSNVNREAPDVYVLFQFYNKMIF